jgi:oligoribonuclease NrnB/cAMP/cGMP phosphodiesterase (DHH superfamily)
VTVSEEREDELQMRIPAFTVKDALYLHEKRLADHDKNATETQRAVQGFEDKFKTLMERINEGVSPTMRRIEAKQGEIEKQIIQLESRLEVKFTEVKAEVKVLDHHFTDKFSSVDDFMGRLRNLVWYVIGITILSAATALLYAWRSSANLENRINAIPTVIETRRR